MSNGKDDADALLGAVMPFAEEMLAKHGEFFPFGAVMRSDREVSLVGGHDGRERPPSQDLIDLLADAFRKSARAGEYLATAIVYDVRVTPTGLDEAMDAIAAELEHRRGYAVTVFFPYRLVGGSPKLDAPFATAEHRDLFGNSDAV